MPKICEHGPEFLLLGGMQAAYFELLNRDRKG